MSFDWHVFVLLTCWALLDKMVDVAGPFRPIKRSNYVLKSGFNAKMAADRGSVEFGHVSVAEVIHCWHKNLVVEE